MNESFLPKEKRYKDISYYKYNSKNQDKTVLFIHGLGYNKNWFPSHLNLFRLSDYSWIVPDLIGHGSSSKLEEKNAYKMEQQAESLLELLLLEEITDLVIIAHSMGGPIALYLIESIISVKVSLNISIHALVYVEGNIDQNDTFFSSNIVKQTWNDFNRLGYERILEIIAKDESSQEYIKQTRLAGPWTLYASSLDLVKVSKKEILLPKIENIANRVKILILFGENNVKKFTSEHLLRKTFPITYIPNSGHDMLFDNPKAFWKIFMEFFKATVG
ncbi:MAG: alpha/beta fold hydrolase [Candidatus Hodarchaeales archaeon]|jgi:2-succinyl-6-hydroxy-2,4-cyclohexadiene-1-carboxylate synthase